MHCQNQPGSRNLGGNWLRIIISTLKGKKPGKRRIAEVILLPHGGSGITGRKESRMKKTIKIADYDTQKNIKTSVEKNAGKLEEITKILESGGGIE